MRSPKVVMLETPFPSSTRAFEVIRWTARVATLRRCRYVNAGTHVPRGPRPRGVRFAISAGWWGRKNNTSLYGCCRRHYHLKKGSECRIVLRWTRDTKKSRGMIQKDLFYPEGWFKTEFWVWLHTMAFCHKSRSVALQGDDNIHNQLQGIKHGYYGYYHPSLLVLLCLEGWRNVRTHYSNLKKSYGNSHHGQEEHGGCGWFHDETGRPSLLMVLLTLTRFVAHHTCPQACTAIHARTHALERQLVSI